MGTLKFPIKFIALSLTLLSLARAGADQRPRTHAVMIKNFAFAPDHLTVSVGDTVVWKNEDSARTRLRLTVNSIPGSSIWASRGVSWPGKRAVIPKSVHIALT